jgi:hypothetical protein
MAEDGRLGESDAYLLGRAWRGRISYNGLVKDDQRTAWGRWGEGGEGEGVVGVLQAVEKGEKIGGAIGDISRDRDTVEDERERGIGGGVAEELESGAWGGSAGPARTRDRTHRASGERERRRCAR